MSRKRWVIVGAAALLVVAGYIGYQMLADRNEAEAIEMTQAVVSRGTLQESVGGTGAIGPSEQVSLGFSSSGEVKEVLVAVGDGVVAEQPLAVLDTTELTLDLASAEASLASARSELVTARQDLQEVLDGPDERELEEAKLSLESAKNSLWATQGRRDATCGRVKAGLGQKYECDQAEASVLQGEGSVRSAQLAYDEVLAGPTESEIAAARDKVTQAESKVTSAESQAEQARLRLEEATLVSPIDGTVIELNVSAGEMAGTSEAAAVVANLSSLEVEINLDETDIASVETGAEASIVLDAFPDDELTGSVSEIAISGATESGVVLFPVTVSVDPTDVPVRPGMTADVEIVTMSVENVLIIPASAVVSLPRGDFVTVPVTETSDEDDSDSGSQAEVGDSSEPGSGMPGQGWGPPGGEGFDPSQMSEMDSERLAAMRQRGMAGTTSLTGETRLIPVELGAATSSQVEVLSGLSEGDIVLVQQVSASSSDTTEQFGRPGGDMRMMGGMFRGGP